VLATLNPLSTAMLVKANWYFVLFVTVSVWVELTVPMLCIPKESYAELRVMVPVLLPLHAGTTTNKIRMSPTATDALFTFTPLTFPQFERELYFPWHFTIGSFSWVTMTLCGLTRTCRNAWIVSFG
jgi:hypothetical protein